jgi:hypothetical protein
MRDDDPGGPAVEPGGKMTGIVLGDRQLKMLKVAVIAMGVILVLGFITVIARIVYLVNRSSETATAASHPVQQAARLALPAGASVRNMSLAGSHLAVHYEGPGGGGIVILDLQTGKPVSRIEIVPEAPR